MSQEEAEQQQFSTQLSTDTSIQRPEQQSSPTAPAQTKMPTPTQDNASQRTTTLKNDKSNTTTTSSSYQQQQLIFPASDVKHFVGGFHSDVTEENLRAHFSKFGAVADVKIMRDPLSGHSRGFGFVTMAEPSSKSRILDEKEHIICGRKTSVRPYTEADLKNSFTDGPILKRKIFVGGVNPALGHDVLENYFGKYGPLEDATIMRYPDGRSRGFGFVVFRDESACQQVLQQRNHFVTPRDKVEVKPCLSRGKSRPLSSMAPEPYYRYNGGVNLGPMHPYHGGTAGAYGYGTASAGYYNPAAAMYGHYGRTGAYDGYGGAVAAHGAGWGSADYRDWWGPYDAYGSYYGGSGSGWHGGYGVGMTPGQQGPYGPGGGGVPRSSGLDSGPPQNPSGRGNATSTDVGYYDLGHTTGGSSGGGGASRPYSHMMSGGGGGVLAAIPPGAGGGAAVSPMTGTAPASHHAYGPLRRGGAGLPPTTAAGVSYSIPRGRGGAY